MHTTSVPMNRKSARAFSRSPSTSGIQCMEPQDESSMLLTL